ncbi:hypothetical protein B9Z55_004477 [Caenorhabditis nigoni]|uniref:F-box domain-containing protein n=2 Tax=Caenorhabditis nigoni TaxID=1611254 RepID=A0A2G5UWP2_9PELO|nr:hypothetical protein B9Z55_004477 [Caenorhabditis nigoni]
MKKFPILKIPDVVFREVISMMTPNEIVKLSMSDFKIELLLRNRKYKLRAIHLQLGNITSRIDMNTTNDCPVVMFQKIDNNKRKPITQLVQLRDRFQKEIDEDLCLTYVSLDEMFSIYSNLNQLFSSREINWILRFDELKLEEFLEYVDRILTTEFYRFKVVGGSMSNDLLRGLMEKVPEKATIVIESDIPSDYSHAKALKFRSFKYREARWLKIEDLFCIRKSYIVKLDITNFDSSDVNRFLNYWSDCDKDMMKEIIITLKEGAQINQQEILKNLIVISDNDGDFQFFM